MFRLKAKHKSSDFLQDGEKVHTDQVSSSMDDTGWRGDVWLKQKKYLHVCRPALCCPSLCKISLISLIHSFIGPQRKIHSCGHSPDCGCLKPFQKISKGLREELGSCLLLLYWRKRSWNCCAPICLGTEKKPVNLYCSEIPANVDFINIFFMPALTKKGSPPWSTTPSLTTEHRQPQPSMR